MAELEKLQVELQEAVRESEKLKVTATFDSWLAPLQAGDIWLLLLRSCHNWRVVIIATREAIKLWWNAVCMTSIGAAPGFSTSSQRVCFAPNGDGRVDEPPDKPQLKLDFI